MTAALATFHHPRYEVPAEGAIMDGAAACRNSSPSSSPRFPDLWLRQRALYHADDAVIVECRFGGTHSGVWAGVAASGKRVEVESVLIFVFEGADLVCEKVYFDNATILRQLGALG